MVGTDNIDSILPYVKLFLYDIKLMDPEKHKKYTGSSSKTILRNLLYIADRIRKNSLHCDVWIRTPIIPGATASEQNIIEIGKFIADCASDVVSRWELCAFNNLCRDKYRRLDRQWEFDSAPLMTREDMEKLLAAARSSGVNKDITIWTGAVRVEE
jgi:pyruvate formate lyase activating enzyme